MYYTTYLVGLNASNTDNGFIVLCYTGIPQCVVSVADEFTPLTSAERAACVNDPRYLTWRSMVSKIDYNGTIDWYRTDSYWNDTAVEFGSTMGTGILLSAARLDLTQDNFAASTATATYGKTFVFAYSDGSGVQFNHLSFGFSYPTTN